MRRIFTLAIIALLLGVGVIALIETDPGYVLVSYGAYTMETSLWVGLVLVFLLVFSVYLVLRVAYRLIGGQRSLLNWMGNRKAQKALRHSTRGLISFTEGNWDKARRQLLRGAQQNESPLFNYLLAARSSGHLQEPEKVQEYLRAAGETESDAAIAVEITLAEMKLEAGDYEQAQAALEKARLNVNKHPYVLSLLQRAYQGLGDWEKLAELLPELKKYKLLSDTEREQLARDVHGHRLAGGAIGTALSADALRGIWQKMPSSVRHDGDMLNSYVSKLVAAGDDDAAEKTILKSLKHQWDSRLVRQLAFLEGGNVSQRLTQAESWLQSHPEDSQLLLCLGRLAARDKLWGKARDYFESSYRLQSSGEVCAELGRLLKGLGEPKVAAAYFQEGLLMREEELPDLAMPDKVVTQHHLVDRS
jgi:HemY protein